MSAQVVDLSSWRLEHRRPPQPVEDERAERLAIRALVEPPAERARLLARVRRVAGHRGEVLVTHHLTALRCALVVNGVDERGTA